MNTITTKQIALLKKLDEENQLTYMTCTEYCWRKVMTSTFPEQEDNFVFPGIENLTKREASETISIALDFARFNRQQERLAKKNEISDGIMHVGDKVQNKIGWTGTVEAVDGKTITVKLDNGQTKKMYAPMLKVID